jgi:hypothetical protein
MIFTLQSSPNIEMSTVPYGLPGQDLDPGRNHNRFLSRKSATFLTLDPSYVQIFLIRVGKLLGNVPNFSHIIYFASC